MCDIQYHDSKQDSEVNMRDDVADELDYRSSSWKILYENHNFSIMYVKFM